MVRRKRVNQRKNPRPIWMRETKKQESFGMQTLRHLGHSMLRPYNGQETYEKLAARRKTEILRRQ